MKIFICDYCQGDSSGEECILIFKEGDSEPKICPFAEKLTDLESNWMMDDHKELKNVLQSMGLKDD